MTVDQFEALVLSQQPAETPWEPTAAVPYDFESRTIAEGSHPPLIKDVFQPTRVLDVGCGPGHLVRMLRALGLEVWGCDVSVPSTCRPWQEQIPWCFRASILDMAEREQDVHEPYDLVICREVLEHLTILQIRRAVTNLCKLSARFVYLTTRFARPRPYEHSFTGYELLEVDTSDDLDPTHITLLDQDFLRVLFVLEGFKRRKDLEDRMDWMKKGRVLVYERAA